MVCKFSKNRNKDEGSVKPDGQEMLKRVYLEASPKGYYLKMFLTLSKKKKKKEMLKRVFSISWISSS